MKELSGQSATGRKENCTMQNEVLVRTGKRRFKLAKQLSLLTLIAVFVIIIGFFLTKPSITGYLALGNESVYTQQHALAVNQSQEINFTIENHPELFALNSLRISGRAIGEGSFRIYLMDSKGNKYLIIDRSSLTAGSNANAITGYAVAEELSEEGDLLINLTENINLKNTTQKTNLTANPADETNLTSDLIPETAIALNLTLNLTPETNLTLNLTPKSNLTSNLTHEINLTTNLTEQAPSDITNQTTSNISILEFNSSCIETCSMIGLNDTDYTIIIEIEGNVTLQLDSIEYTLQELILAPEPPKQAITFNRTIECSGCIGNIVPPKTEINITITANTTIPIYRANLTEIYPADWVVSDTAGAYSSVYDDTHYKLEWELSNVAEVSKTYTIKSPAKKGDYEFKTKLDNYESNIVNITVEKTKELIEENISELQTLTQQHAEINKPVKWLQRIKFSEQRENILLNITKKANALSVYKIIDEQKIPVLEGNVIEKQKEEMFAVQSIEEPELIKESEQKELVINETAQELEIEYYTSAPEAIEENISQYRKIITVTSDVHYTGILTYTFLPTEASSEAVHLYWLVNSSRIEVNADKYDTNNNSLIDYIEWLTPYLSNQTYELEINIINVHSYPSLYGNWTVLFETTGTADLKITASSEPNYTSEPTRWHNEEEDENLYDLKFLELKCGNETLDYEWQGSNCNEQECSVFVANYSCNETGSEISKVLTPKKHVLRFEFGGLSAYAYNIVSALTQCTNLSQAGTTYQLQNNISSSGTCISIEAGNIELNCLNYLINYSQSSVGYGINNTAGYHNITVRNCRIEQGLDTVGSHAIVYNLTTNGSIFNNTITTSGNNSRGVFLDTHSDSNTIANNTIKAYGINAIGILVEFAFNVTISNNTVITYNESAWGINIHQASNLTIVNNTINVSLGAYGIRLRESNYSTLTTNTISATGRDSSGIWLRINNYFNTISYNNITTTNTVGPGQYGVYLSESSHFNNISNNLIRTYDYYGIYVDTTNSTVIYNNSIVTVTSDAIGILMITSPRSNITYNTVTTPGSYGHGISMTACNSSSIANNTITTTGNFSRGIRVSTSQDLNISFNTINATKGYAIEIIGAKVKSHYNHTIENNTEQGRPIYYYFNNNSITVSNDGNIGQLIVAGSDNVTFRNITILNDGITLLLTGNSTIDRSNISISEDNIYGIYLNSYSISNTISNSTITTSGGNGYALYLLSGSNSTRIINNVITTSGSSGYGIVSSGSDLGNITNNTITTSGSGGHGMYLAASSNLTLFNNTVTTSNSNSYGIYLDANLNLTSIVNSTISTFGSAGHGIYLKSGSNLNTITNSTIQTNTTNACVLYISSSSNNTIYNNIFNSSNDSSSGSGIFFTGTFNNTWNTTKTAGTNIIRGNNLGGNYWTNKSKGGFSDNCTDFDRDDICDSSYTLNGTEIDYLPLVTQSNRLPTISNIVLNATATQNRSFDNLTLYFNQSDADGDNVTNITNWYRNGTSIMVLNMPFEAWPGNGTHTTANWTKDYSPYGNNGTVYGALWNSTGGYNRFGAYQFDGVNDYIEINSSASVSLGTAITLSAWIKDVAEINQTPRQIISKLNEYLMRWDNSSDMGCFVYLDGSWELRVGVASNLSKNTWHHIACTWDNSTGNLKIYVDGEFSNAVSNRTGAVNLSSNPLRIGTWDGTIGFWNGSIDNVQIYNRSLSEEQVNALYKNRTNLIVNNELRKGDVWYAEITPNDGTEDGTTATSNNITIANSPPIFGRFEKQFGSELKDADILNATGGSNQSNQGSATDLGVGGSSSVNSAVRSLVEFNLTYLINISQISETTLSLYTPNLNGWITNRSHAVNITPYIMLESWNEGTGNWENNNATINGTTWHERWFGTNWNIAGGNFSQTVNGTPTQVQDYGWYSINLTNLFRYWTNGTYPNYGLILKGPEQSSQEEKYFYSSDSAANPPKLVIIHNISNITITKNTNVTLNMSYFFSDVDNDVLVYSVNDNDSISVRISNDLVTLVPPAGWSGSDNITITANDSTNTNVSNIFFLNVVDYPPFWSNNKTSIVSNYSPTTESKFNITWIDDVAVSTARFESNYSGAAANYTMNNITSNVYNYSSILPAGYHYWKSYANDSANQWNETDTWNFTISRTNPTINLTLNNNDSNITVEAGNFINLSAYLITPPTGYLELYNDTRLLNNGTANLSNYTQYTIPGIYNITMLYKETQNYSFEYETHYLIINCTNTDNDAYNGTGYGCGVRDCNDANALIYPGAIESCNDIDDDCDGSTDEDSVCCGNAACEAGKGETTATCAADCGSGGGGGGGGSQGVLGELPAEVIVPVSPDGSYNFTPRISTIMLGSTNITINFTNTGNETLTNLKFMLDKPGMEKRAELLHPRKVWGWNLLDLLGWILKTNVRKQSKMEWGISSPQYYKIVNPGESVKATFEVTAPLTRLESVNLEFKVLSSSKEIAVQTIPLRINTTDFTVVPDIHSDKNTVDIYMLISNQHNTDKEYYVELNINTKPDPAYNLSSSVFGRLRSLFKGPKTVIADQYGPFRISANNVEIFAYEYEYSEKFKGNYYLKYVLYEGDERKRVFAGEMNLIKNQ